MGQQQRRRWTNTALEIFMVAAILAPAIWVAIPRAHASTASATDTGSLTVTAKWVATTSGTNTPGQEVTLSGTAPAASGCPSTQACEGLFASLLGSNTACPSAWNPSQQSVLPTSSSSSYVAAGSFSKTFTLSAGEHSELNNPSSYHLCGYLVDESTQAQSTVAAAETPLGTHTVGSASLTVTATGPSSAADNDKISVDLTGSTPESAYLYLTRIEDGKQCGATMSANGGTVNPVATLGAGEFSQHIDFAGLNPGYYGFCGYLLFNSNPPSTGSFSTQPPNASGSAYHVITSLPCPAVDFSVDDAQQTHPFWAAAETVGGGGSMHVTVPGPGTVTVEAQNGDDSGGSREVGKAGTFGIDVHFLPENIEDLYKAQQSETEAYTVTFVPDWTGSCVEPDQTTFIGEPGRTAEDYTGEPQKTETTSIDWTPATAPYPATGCYSVQVTCHERKVTLQLTRTSFSGTVKQTDGGKECPGTAAAFQVAQLFQDTPRGLVAMATGSSAGRISLAKAKYGKYSGKLTGLPSWAEAALKKGGRFVVYVWGEFFVDPDTGRGADYSCGGALSNIVKL